MPDPSTPLDDSLTIAAEHVAWAIKNGRSLTDILVALNETIHDSVSRDHVIGRVAAAWRLLGFRE